MVMVSQDSTPSIEAVDEALQNIQHYSTKYLHFLLPSEMFRMPHVVTGPSGFF